MIDPFEHASMLCTYCFAKLVCMYYPVHPPPPPTCVTKVICMVKCLCMNLDHYLASLKVLVIEKAEVDKSAIYVH